jgi:hypothetical protein
MIMRSRTTISFCFRRAYGESNWEAVEAVDPRGTQRLDKVFEDED